MAAHDSENQLLRLFDEHLASCGWQRSVGRKARHFAHDINNHLSSLYGMLQLLERSLPHEDHLRTSLTCARQMRTTVRALSRFLHFHLDDEPVETSVQEVLTGTLEFFQVGRDDRELTVKADLPGREMRLFCRTGPVSSIFMTLVEMAETACRGKKRAVLRITGRSEPDCHYIDFSDSGRSIKAAMPVTLEQAIQVEDEKKRAVLLSLAECCRNAADIHGKLELVKPVAGGNTFRVVLPVNHTE